MDNLKLTAILAPVILFSLTIHEYFHALSACLLGDSTAKERGRLTFNPLSHLDLMGTLFLFFFNFGWAKPVPINPLRFRDPRKGILLVSLSGPFSNLFFGFISGMLLRFLLPYELYGGFFTYLLLLLILALKINLSLALFNLLPLPPLDGSRIFSGICPKGLLPFYASFERYGIFILFSLIFISSLNIFPIFHFILWKPLSFLSYIFSGKTLPELSLIIYTLM